MAYKNYDYDSKYDRDAGVTTDADDRASARNWLVAGLSFLGVVAVGFFIANYVYNPFTGGPDQNRVDVSQNIVPGTTDTGDMDTIQPGTTDTGTGINQQDVTSPTIDEDESDTARLEMRRLWTEHSVWTREYINSSGANIPNTDEIAARLMKNQEDLGTAIGQYLGSDTGTQLTTLLKEHINIVVDLVAAAKANNTSEVRNATDRANQNADQIADLLSSSNPNWSENDLSSMLREHVRLLGEEINAVMQKNYDRSISLFDEILRQALQMADAMSTGFSENGSNVPTASPAPTPAPSPSPTPSPNPAPSPAPSSDGTTPNY